MPCELPRCTTALVNVHILSHRPQFGARPKRFVDGITAMPCHRFVSCSSGTLLLLGVWSASCRFYPGCIDTLYTPKLSKIMMDTPQKNGKSTVAVPHSGIGGWNLRLARPCWWNHSHLSRRNLGHSEAKRHGHLLIWNHWNHPHFWEAHVFLMFRKYGYYIHLYTIYDWKSI